MTLLSKANILEAEDLCYEDVDVPEWGGTVRVKALTGTERDSFEASINKGRKNPNDPPNMDNLRARLVALAIVDEKGDRVFADNEVKVLGKKSAVVLNRLFDIARKLSGIGDQDVEDLEQNFTNGQSGDSTSV